MASYRYYAADLLTGGVISELPLYGVWMQRILSAAGQLTATFKLGTGMYRDADLLQGSDPSRTALYVERDGTLIWGGIIWSRTWAEQSSTCQLSAQTFESIFSKVVLEADFVQQDVDQGEIFRQLIIAVQGQSNNNFGLNTSLMTSNTGVLRTVLVPGYEFHFASEVVEQLIGVDNGLDYTITLEPSGTVDQPTKVVRTGYPQIGSTAMADTMVFDYPGNVDDFYWPESGADGATKKISMGAGAGEIMLHAQVNAEDLLAAGYPAWYRVDSYKDIVEQGTLEDKTRADAIKYRMPLTVPTFDMKPDTAAAFDGWDRLGNGFQVHLESKRFPSGMDYAGRMVGWELSPADSDTDEALKLIIDGDDNG